MDNNDQIIKIVNELSAGTDKITNELAIILAAGHGKRLKSEKSKMLHTILGVPTVERVYNACKEGIEDIYTIIVVGIKAVDIMEHLGKREKTMYAYQQMQNGTGHAVQVALEGLKNIPDDTIVYILPGDMGLIDAETIKQFREDFLKSRAKDNSRNVIQIMEHKDILALSDDKLFTTTYQGKEYS